MPSNPPIQLELDPTGLNPNNRITDEPHTLSNNQVRSIAPTYAPFFAESLEVKEGAVTLTRGIDYQIVELHQEATLKYGKEISSVILIINTSIGSNVTITYNSLGGHYVYDSVAIENMYNSVMNDNRPVAWGNILNKPSEFTPTIHRHLLDDVYGFEVIVDYLERIKTAITLGQTNVVLEIIQYLLRKFKYRELPKILPSNKVIQYDALLYFLTRRKIASNIWVDKKDDIWYKGNSAVVQVDTSAYPVGTTIYWYLYRPDNLALTLFSVKQGTIKSNGSIQEFQIYIPALANVIDYPVYIGVKTNPNADEFLAVTYALEVEEYVETDSLYGYMLYSTQELNDYEIRVGEIDNDDERRLYYVLTNY